MLLFAVAAAVVTTSAVTASAAVRGGSTSVQALRNPLGLTLVRFAKGTSTAQIEGAIQAAGGSVLLTVPQLGVAEAAPGGAGAAAFVRAVSKQKGVTVAYQEKLVPLVDPDAGPSGGSSEAKAPQLGSPGADPIPDPWHDAPTIFGEVNPGESSSGTTTG